MSEVWRRLTCWPARLLGWLFCLVYVRGGRYGCFNQGPHLARHASPSARSTGFGWTLYQVMISDTERLAAYRRDLEACVRGLRVLEIGPGPTAVLTRMALEAGAGSVTSAEATPWVARAAARRLRRTGTRVRVLAKSSDDLTEEDVGHDRRFDLLLQESYHPIASQEGVVETVASLRRRGFRFGSVVSRGFVTFVAPAAAPPVGTMTPVERLALGWPLRASRAAADLCRRPSTVHGSGPAVPVLDLAPRQRWQVCDLEGDGRLVTAPMLSFAVPDASVCAGLVFSNAFLFHDDSVLDTARTLTEWGVFFLPLGLPPGRCGPTRLRLGTEVPDPARPSEVVLRARLGPWAAPAVRLGPPRGAPE